MSPPETDLERLTSRVRTLEARVSQLEDWKSLHPVRRLPIPDITPEQSKTLAWSLVYIALMMLMTYGERAYRRESS